MVMRSFSAGGGLACVIVVAGVHGCSGNSGTSNDAGGVGGDGTTASSDASTNSSGVGSSSDASSGSRDGSAVGEGGGLAGDSGGSSTHPPLQFSTIGQAVLISSQFYWTEGPVWDPSKNVLYFTDINAHQDGAGSDVDGGDGGGDDGSVGGGMVGGAIYRLTLPNTIDVLLQPDGNADGIALDPQRDIVAAGFVSRDVWRLSASNTMEAFAPCSQGGGACYAGQEINTPDDITARADGVIYFTDPTFGSGGLGFPTQTLALSNAQGVYRLTTDGVLHLEDETTSGPNGVNLSPDQKTLYVAYTLSGQVAKFDVAADGSLSNKTTFATGATLADSMCVDSRGNLYVGTYSGLAVYDATSKHLGTISVAGLIVTNCAFGGADQRSLFITARTQATLTGAPPLGGGSLYEIANMPVPGIPGQN
jgi:gluconolactonase